MAKIVVALGGNALGNSPEEQLKLVENTAKSLIALVQKGNEVVISHGNGPRPAIPIPRMWCNEPSLYRLSTTTKFAK